MAAIGFVYLIAQSGLTKIGKSKRPTDRRTQIAWSGKATATILHTISTPHPGWLERILHRAFRHKHVRGEWFDLDPADVSRAQSITYCAGPSSLPAWLSSPHIARAGEPHGRDCSALPSSGFGKRLRALREAAELSQQEVAQQANCSLFTISKMERGLQEPAWPLVLALAGVFGVSTEAFKPEKEDQQ